MNKVRLNLKTGPGPKPSGPTVGMDTSFIKFVSKVAFKDPDHLWASYDFKNRGGFISQQEQLCVEAYCCGFLTYYEYVARNRVYSFDEIYFEWLQKGKGKKAFSLVNVYLNPPPVKKSYGRRTVQAAGGVTGMQEFSDPPVGPHPPPPPMG